MKEHWEATYCVAVIRKMKEKLVLQKCIEAEDEAEFLILMSALRMAEQEFERKIYES